MTVWAGASAHAGGEDMGYTSACCSETTTAFRKAVANLCFCVIKFTVKTTRGNRDD